jgi:PAS domain S-box-containing protein
MQRDGRKTKAELIEELQRLRSYISGFNKSNNDDAGGKEFINAVLLKAFLENAADGVIVGDPENKKIVVGNSKFCQMLGYDSDEIEYLRPEDIHPGEMHPNLEENIKKQLGTKGRIAANVPVQRKDGSIFYADINSFLMIIAGKQYTMAFYRDVTDRKKTEDALKQSEQKLRSLTTNIPGMIYRATPDWFVDLITNSREICGYLPEEFYSRRVCWLDLIHPLDKERIFSEGSQFERASQPITQTYRIITKNGEVRWVEDHKMPLFNEQRQFLGVDGVVFDMTKREKMEEALFDERNKLQTILEVMRSGVTIRDMQYNIIFENEYMNKYFGNHLGQKCYQAYENRDNICKGCPVEMAFKNGRSHTSLKTMTLPSGELSYWESTANPIRDPVGNITSCLVVNVNITERRKTQAELNRFREEMARAEQLASVGTLSAIAAHELTQPLTVIRLLIENAMTNLQSNYSAADISDKLRDSLVEITNITSVVDRLRNFARKSTGKGVTEVNLGEIARRIVNLIGESVHRSAFELVLEGIDGLPNLYINEKDLEQMFFSLITNAIQAGQSRKNCKLVISAVRKGDFIELRFADNCGGIEPKTMEKIFEPFFTTKPEGEGTGLGLCIVQDVVTRAGGRIRVESEYGKGANFIVLLPVKK